MADRERFPGSPGFLPITTGYSYEQIMQDRRSYRELKERVERMAIPSIEDMGPLVSMNNEYDPNSIFPEPPDAA